MKAIRILLGVHLLGFAWLGFLQLTDMFFPDPTGMGPAQKAFWAWVPVMAFLALPAAYALQTRWTRFKIPVSLGGGAMYLALALFPQQLFVPTVAIPILGGYREKYMYMGSLLDGFNYYTHSAFHFVNAMLAFFIVTAIGGAFERVRLKQAGSLSDWEEVGGASEA